MAINSVGIISVNRHSLIKHQGYHNTIDDPAVAHMLCTDVCSTNVVYCVTTGTVYIAATVADANVDVDIVVTVASNAGGAAP